ncbi:hypothetical protein I4U23_022142 [Adineta vaga]|nr:hypothetical protein I4U23_022142 [Adineta vaga]
MTKETDHKLQEESRSYQPICAVIRRRTSTSAINSMDPREEILVEQRQRILQNTLEQLLIQLSLSLVLCTILKSNEFILLPIYTILFIIGRFTFALGYPNYRSFGMTMNIASAILIIVLINYCLFVERSLFQYIKFK